MITAIHDGTLGDVIYSIPCLLGLLRYHNETKANFYLRINQPAVHAPGSIHPLGHVLMTREWAECFVPLLKAQPYINDTGVWDGQPVTHDLNRYRHIGVDFASGSISRWPFYGFPESNYDLSRPWLYTKPDIRFRNCIIVNRTIRYNNPNVSYKFLAEYPDVVFVGLEPEYQRLKEDIPNLRYHPTDNYLELSQAIAGCRFFVGGQSFAWSLADAMKVPRVLERAVLSSNVLPEGPDGWDAIDQHGLETIVRILHRSY